MVSNDATKIYFNVEDKTALTSASENDWIWITYKTKIADYKEFLAGGTQSYTNNVKLYSNNQQIGTTDLTATFAPKDHTILAKNGTYSASTAPFANYTIDVNPNGLDLVSSVENKLSLTDVMGSGLDFVPGSLAIYTDSARTNELSASLYTYSFNTDTKTLTIVIPDETPCYISYKTQVLIEPGTTLTQENAGNTVTLSGYESSQGSASKQFSGNAIRSAGWSEATSGSFTIIKHEEGNQLEVLPNAKFRVWIVKVYDGTNILTPSEDYLEDLVANGLLVDDILTSNAKGKISINNLKFDHLYAIQEVEAPDGYQLDSTIHYYYVKGNNNADFGVGTVSVLSGQTFYFSNDVKEYVAPTIELSKKAINGTNELPGAKLKLVDENNNTVISWDSTYTSKTIVIGYESGQLVPGSYTLVEETAPDGYVVAESILFSVDADGVITLLGSNGELDGNTITMRDDYSQKINEESDEKVSSDKLTTVTTSTAGVLAASNSKNNPTTGDKIKIAIPFVILAMVIIVFIGSFFLKKKGTNDNKDKKEIE